MGDDVLARGEAVERYVVDEKIGAGGMSEVYLVHHATLGSPHALKVLTLTGPSLHRRLMSEGQVQARISHPNLVKVSDVLTVHGLPALVMEYIDGPDLGEWIQQHKPDPVVAERLFRGIVAGVAAAHAAGIVHRDLKPSNVLLASDVDGSPIPKVGDFGLMKLTASTLVQTKAGQPMGTPQYMAPEQIRDAANVDQRADVFALGCVLYELLSHQVAYPGKDLMEIFLKVNEGRRAPLPSGIPRRLASLVDWCLMLDPAQRPADASAILRGLDGELPVGLKPPPTPGPAPSRPGGAPTPTTEPVQLAAWLALAGGMTVLLGMTLGVVVWVISRTPSPPPSAPVAPDPVPVAAPEPAPVAAPAPAPPPAPAPAPAPTGGACPTEGDRAIGWIRAPEVFVKPASSVWTLRDPRPVWSSVPNGEVVCELPAGAQIRVPRDRAKVGGGIALQLRPRDVTQHPARPVEEPQGEVAADRCTGGGGERIGWFFTKLRDRGDDAPYRGGTWEISYARYVYDDVPRRGADGAVVCALPQGSALDVKQDPVRGSGGYWVPLVDGALHR